MTTTATATVEDQSAAADHGDDDIVTFSTTHDKDGNAIPAETQPSATPDADTATTAAPADGEKKGDATTQAEDGTEEDDARRPDESPQQHAARTRSKLQKRIDRITGERYQEKGRADQLAAENERLRQQLAKPGSSSTSTSGEDTPDDTTRGTADTNPHAEAFERAHPKPNEDDFANYSEFVDKLTDWKSDRKDFIRDQTTEAARVAEATRTRDERVRTNVKAFAEKTPDYDAVMANAASVNLPTHAHAALLESEHGAAIAYSLVKNPAQAQALFQLSPTEQIKWVGKQEVLHTKAAVPSPPRKPSTNAPDPIEPVGGPAAHRKSEDEMDTDERLDKWDREERDARQRRR